MQAKSELLLIYIPCYTDYQLAISQAQKIQSLKKYIAPEMYLDVRVMISSNGVPFSADIKSEIENVCDYLNVIPFGISGDINITQGFFNAIKLEADYFWILSSNDCIADNFIQTIYNGLIKRRNIDLLVACTSKQIGLRRVTSVFEPENRDIPFGLISSVVYRTKNMSRNYDTAVQLNWTGWGQLATIEASCISLGGLNAFLVEESGLYIRSIRSVENKEEEDKRVRNGYAHSFFGMPIVISILQSANPEKRKKYLNGWIRSNWYLVNYFLGTDFKLWNSHIASNQIWLREIAFKAVGGASLPYRALFGISRVLNLHALRNLETAKWLMRRIRK